MPQQMHPNGQHLPQMPSQPQIVSNMAMYQKVPVTNGYGVQQPMLPDQTGQMKHQQYYPIIQAAPKATTKKVSFEPGTKGESDSISCDSASSITSSSPIGNKNDAAQTALTVTAIPTRVFNNSAIVKASAKAVQCNLCRKKHVIAPAIYCSDCEFYMSRFQPKPRA